MHGQIRLTPLGAYHHAERLSRDLSLPHAREGAIHSTECEFEAGVAEWRMVFRWLLNIVQDPVEGLRRAQSEAMSACTSLIRAIPAQAGRPSKMDRSHSKCRLQRGCGKLPICAHLVGQSCSGVSLRTLVPWWRSSGFPKLSGHPTQCLETSAR